MIKINVKPLKFKNPLSVTWGFFMFLCLISYTKIHSQKVTEKSWDGKAFEKIEISSNEVFIIEIFAGKTSHITLKTKISGEHFENISIGASEKDKTLSLYTSYRPYFSPINDKLAAHKVISIEITLHIPENRIVSINAGIASLLTEGNFLKLEANLNEGNCVLNNFMGHANLNTNLGDIIVYAQHDVYGIVNTKNGVAKNTLPDTGMYFIKAESVNGNISLLKTTE